MSNLRRYNPDGRPVFITSVTHNRRKILLQNIDVFWAALNNIISKYKIGLVAWAILPDHFHILIEPRDISISRIVHDFKMSFSIRYRKKRNLREGRIWQLRFWDHIIRDEKDWIRHLDYIHYNPVKHFVTKSLFDYPHSSIQKYPEYYGPDWGVNESPKFQGEYGE